MKENKEKGNCVWIFGMNKTGKTTTAYNLMQKKLRNWILLDGDKFRRSMTPSLDFTREDIIENNNECLKLVKYLNSEGWNVLVSMITPFKEMRDKIKEEMKDDVFMIKLSCPYDVRQKRRNFFDSDIEFEEGEFDLSFKTSDFTEDEVRDDILKNLMDMKWC